MTTNAPNKIKPSRLPYTSPSPKPPSKKGERIMGILGVRKKMCVWEVTVIDYPLYLRNYRTFRVFAYTGTEVLLRCRQENIVGYRLKETIDNSELKAFSINDVTYPKELL